MHHTNWQSAEGEPTVVQELIDKEIDAGWVVEFNGTIDEAQSYFQDGLAIGKLGLALSDSRPPRLVLDSTICGVNQQSQIPEKSSLPTARDVLRAYPLRNTRKVLSRVSFDVKCSQADVCTSSVSRFYVLSIQRTSLLLQSLPFWGCDQRALLVQIGRSVSAAVSSALLFTPCLIPLRR